MVSLHVLGHLLQMETLFLKNSMQKSKLLQLIRKFSSEHSGTMIAHQPHNICIIFVVRPSATWPSSIPKSLCCRDIFPKLNSTLVCNLYQLSSNVEKWRAFMIIHIKFSNLKNSTIALSEVQERWQAQSLKGNFLILFVVFNISILVYFREITNLNLYVWHTLCAAPRKNQIGMSCRQFDLLAKITVGIKMILILLWYFLYAIVAIVIPSFELPINLLSLQKWPTN